MFPTLGLGPISHPLCSCAPSLCQCQAVPKAPTSVPSATSPRAQDTLHPIAGPGRGGSSKGLREGGLGIGMCGARGGITQNLVSSW